MQALGRSDGLLLGKLAMERARLQQLVEQTKNPTSAEQLARGFAALHQRKVALKEPTRALGYFLTLASDGRSNAERCETQVADHFSGRRPNQAAFAGCSKIFRGIVGALSDPAVSPSLEAFKLPPIERWQEALAAVITLPGNGTETSREAFRHAPCEQYARVREFPHAIRMAAGLMHSALTQVTLAEPLLDETIDGQPLGAIAIHAPESAAAAAQFASALTRIVGNLQSSLDKVATADLTRSSPDELLLYANSAEFFENNPEFEPVRTRLLLESQGANHSSVVTGACVLGACAAALMTGPGALVVGAIGTAACVADTALAVKAAVEATYLYRSAYTLKYLSPLTLTQQADEIKAKGTGAWLSAGLSATGLGSQVVSMARLSRGLRLVPIQQASAKTLAGKESVARAYYLSTPGFDDARFAQHFSGINIDKDVEVIKLRKGTVVHQWVDPGRGVGRYFSLDVVKPEQLGIYSGNRTLKRFVVSEDVDVLRSTAAPINDTWSVPGKVIPCQGGATQLFVKPTELFRPLD